MGEFREDRTVPFYTTHTCHDGIHTGIRGARTGGRSGGKESKVKESSAVFREGL